jgi:hypothetical protein
MDENISQFCSITNATPKQATFFLEAANGDVEMAVMNFFSANEGEP